MINIEHARNDTPGCENIIHFNNAGASLMPQPVVEAINSYLLLEVKHGGYEAEVIAEGKIRNFYYAASKLLRCHPTEIAFIESATRAWDMVFHSLDFKDGDKILTTSHEYGSNYLSFLQLSRKKKVSVEIIPNKNNGSICLAELEKRLDKNVKLLAITHIPMQGGAINPAEKIGEIAKRTNVFYLLDATQSVGQLPLDVNKIKCDALCATGRKYLRGPRGTGFIYINCKAIESLDPPFIDLHAAYWIGEQEYKMQSDARRFETWETSRANKIGLGAAIDYALCRGIDNIWERVCSLAKFLRESLAKIPDIDLHDTNEEGSGLVTFSSEKIFAQEFFLLIKENGANVSVCSKAHARLDLRFCNISSFIRASVHYYNTEEEIERFCQKIKHILSKP